MKINVVIECRIMWLNVYTYINVMLNMENCCVTLDKVGEGVITNLGTNVIVVVVVVVVKVVGRYTHGVIHTHTLLTAHALECSSFNC